MTRRRRSEPPPTCPHAADIVYCPLYLASHIPDGGGCADNRLDEGGCAVTRGKLDYQEAVTRFATRFPRAFAIQRFHEEHEAAQRQRRRNMEVNGIH